VGVNCLFMCSVIVSATLNVMLIFAAYACSLFVIVAKVRPNIAQITRLVRLAILINSVRLHRVVAILPSGQE